MDSGQSIVRAVSATGLSGRLAPMRLLGAIWVESPARFPPCGLPHPCSRREHEPHPSPSPSGDRPCPDVEHLVRRRRVAGVAGAGLAAVRGPGTPGDRGPHAGGRPAGREGTFRAREGADREGPRAGQPPRPAPARRPRVGGRAGDARDAGQGRTGSRADGPHRDRLDHLPGQGPQRGRHHRRPEGAQPAGGPAPWITRRHRARPLDGRVPRPGRPAEARAGGAARRIPVGAALLEGCRPSRGQAGLRRGPGNPGPGIPQRGGRALHLPARPSGDLGGAR